MMPCADINELLGSLVIALLPARSTGPEDVGAVLVAFSDIPDIPAGLEPQ